MIIKICWFKNHRSLLKFDCWKIRCIKFLWAGSCNCWASFSFTHYRDILRDRECVRVCVCPCCCPGCARWRSLLVCVVVCVCVCVCPCVCVCVCVCVLVHVCVSVCYLPLHYPSGGLVCGLCEQ